MVGRYVNSCRSDALHDMGPQWMGQPRRTISEGRASLLSIDVETIALDSGSVPNAVPPSSPEVESGRD